jgi:hypothetical protein
MSYTSIHKAIPVTILSALVMVMALLGGCEERIPEENTPAIYKLHGIVNDGKTVNEITLINDRNDNHPKLRFPPQIPISVYTPDTHNPNPKVIRKGFAYRADVTLELNDKQRLIPITRTPDHLVYDTVSIRFSASLGSQTEATEKRVQEIARLSPDTTDRHDLGLREYRPKSPGWGQGIYFVPLDEFFRLPDGEKLLIGCQGTTVPNGNVGSCSTSFKHPSGTAVTYEFRSEVLQDWRQIYQEVYKFTDSVLVK